MNCLQSLGQKVNSSLLHLCNLCSENELENKLFVSCVSSESLILLQSALEHVKTLEQRAKETTTLCCVGSTTGFRIVTVELKGTTRKVWLASAALCFRSPATR
jgi:hypothetical protein